MASLVAPDAPPPDAPLIVVVGPTGSGKTLLALRLALQFGGEIISCDSVAVYRGMEIGTAKPTQDERALVPHHMIDVAWPNEACTAGDYSRMAREALAGIGLRRHLPIIAGGTGLYLRALVDGLFPSPPRQDALRAKLRRRAAARGAVHLHRILARLDPRAGRLIHPNDTSKAIRAIEVSLAARQPLSEQWQKGRNALSGYSILRLGLNPPRDQLYQRINLRAATMFDRGLITETQELMERFGTDCRPLRSLGYAETMAALQGECTYKEAVERAQQGHRNYAKRQGTWFRREPGTRWISGFGGDEAVWEEARGLVQGYLERFPRGTS